MSNEETRKTYRLTANKTKLYALAKRIYPNIEPMKNTDFIKYYRVRDYALEFWSGENFHHLFLSVCGGKARLADRWSAYDENDERTEHWECRAIDLHRLTGDAFSRFWPGEIVRVVDDEDGVNLRTRIVSVVKDDAQGDPGNVTVTLANKSKDIAGSISDLQSRALIGETYAQGATNQQVYNFSDNADATHPATMKIYIDESVVRINKMLLNIQFEPFRAFEKAIGGGGGQTTSSGGGSTTSSGGGSTTSSGGGSTTSSGGGQTSSATALESSNILPNETNGQAVHNHGLSSGAHLAIVDISTLEVVGWEDFVWSGAHVHPAHTHKISAHTHRVDAHTHRVSAHTHTVSSSISTLQLSPRLLNS